MTAYKISQNTEKPKPPVPEAPAETQPSWLKANKKYLAAGLEALVLVALVTAIVIKRHNASVRLTQSGNSTTGTATRPKPTTKPGTTIKYAAPTYHLPTATFSGVTNSIS